MVLELKAPSISFRADDDGTIRIGNSRVRLETVVYAFNQGYTAEEISSHYPALNLMDVYAVISYYLHNKDKIDTYIRKQETEADKIQYEFESKPGYKVFRERLLARYND